MLPTQSAGAGRFSAFDLSRVPSPCFVVDEVALRRNLEILSELQAATNVHVLLALKAFSMWSLADMVGEYLSGTCASGLWEAQLARRHYRGELAVYAPGYKAHEIETLAELADHLIFNTPAQVSRFRQAALHGGADIGLRINPQHSEGLVEKYDPCAQGSRLGWPVSMLGDRLPDGVSGLHMHTLCEQGFAPLDRTIASIRPVLDRLKGQFSWLNLGGGHLVTGPNYEREKLAELLRLLAKDYNAQLYLELGGAVAFDTSILVGEVLDVFDNDGAIAITDISATCHMPDVIEAPYRPGLRDERAASDPDSVPVRLGGPSCLAGDIIGEYYFERPPEIGQRIAFLDQGHYSMVKTTTFNGVILPSIAIWNSETDALRVIKSFDYSDFENRLS